MIKIVLMAFLITGLPVSFSYAQSGSSSGIRESGPVMDVMKKGKKRGRLEKSLDETINQELFTLTIVYTILALLPLSVLGVVAYKAQQTRTKISPYQRRGRTKASSRNSKGAVIHTRDLYDVSPRGQQGQAVNFQRSRHWKYAKHTEGHLAFPVAEIQAKSVRHRQNGPVSTDRSRTRHQWKYKQSPASTI